MNKFLFSFILSAASLNGMATSLSDDETLYFSEASAAHGYVESVDGKVGFSGINIPGEDRDDNGLPKLEKKLTSWTSTSACAVYFFHHPAARVKTSIKLTVPAGKKVNFVLTITDPDHPEKPLVKKEINFKSRGGAQLLELADTTYAEAKYYRYQLACTAGNTSITNIDRFVFESPSQEKSYAASYLSSPSVHLGSWHSSQSNVSRSKVYNWCYQEIMVPQSSDIVGTYAMALGVLSGYMGIQNNGTQSDGSPRHEVLFSMWDDGSTDEDPNLPDYLRAGIVDWDPQTTTNRFGGEGTGVQTYRRGNWWTPGRFVQFLTNARREKTSYTTIENGKEVVHQQNNMLVSAWFNAQDGKGWQYMATVRKRNSTSFFDTWYSFLENYNWPTGQASRLAYYKNGYARNASTNRWYNFNVVDFSHTDGGSKQGARNDYGQGATPDDAAHSFFMQTGGYTSTNLTSTTVPLATSSECVDTINYDALNLRVLQAIENEKARVEEANLFNTCKYDKSNWKVISFSSQETSGEGTNGRAAQIIDGDTKTYWHSQWTGGGSTYPHTFVIDMQDENSIGGFQITMSGGTNRYIKSYDIYGSDDNENWTKIYSDEDAPNKETFQVRLQDAVNARYLKLVIRKGRATDGNHVRINEFDVVSGVVATSIAPIATVSSGKDLKVNVQGKDINVTLPSQVGNATALRVYTTNGVCCYYHNFAAGESIAASLPQLPAGTYIVEADWKSGSASTAVILK